MSKKISIPEKTLRQLYEVKGLSRAKIAEIYDCTIWTVRKLMREYSIKPRRREEQRRGCNLPKETLRQLYAEMSAPEIGEICGCSKYSVYSLMEKYGIERRTQAQAKLMNSRRKPCDLTFDEKVYFKGITIGDLTVYLPRKSSSTLIVSCHSTKQEMIDLVRHLFNPYGACNIWQDSRQIYIRCLLDAESWWWLYEAWEKKAFEEEDLKDVHRFFKAAAGYLDAEGSFGVYDGKARFQLASQDVEVIFQLYYSFRRQGIEFPEPRVTMPAGFVHGYGGVNRKDMWRLSTANKAALCKLIVKVGPLLRLPKRISDVKAAATNLLEREKTTWKPLPRDCRKELEKLLKELDH